MSDFDNRLLALANCSVIPSYPSEAKKEGSEHAGGIIFDPHPSIVATDDLVLSHELCHLLAGKRDYDIFLTSSVAKDSELFKYILNLLYDWYHEITQENYSPFLAKKIAGLHEEARKIVIPPAAQEMEELTFLRNLYLDRTESPEQVGVRHCHDLVFIAERMYVNIIKRRPDKALKAINSAISEIQKAMARVGITGAGSSTYGAIPKKSNFYARTVAKYSATIQALKNMWLRNKYNWVRKHHGEIDWKNLTRVFMGEKLSWPVFLILSKITLKKKIYLCVDRSSSTQNKYKNTGIPLKNFIMELAVIVAESLRLCEVPIVVLDVGVQDDIVNKTGEVDPSWYTPMDGDTTPLGRVCSRIEERDANSILIIITDGEPDDFESLVKAIHRFPGDNINFVIGSSYPQYAARIANSVLAEPNTILRDLKTFVKGGGHL
jgi:hypothetical protein